MDWPPSVNPKPMLVLLDLMLPGMDGWEVYRRMKADEAMKNIPVIIVTAKAEGIDEVLAKHIAKVDDYIKKPFSLQELWQSIDRVMARAAVQRSKGSCPFDPRKNSAPDLVGVFYSTVTASPLRGFDLGKRSPYVHPGRVVVFAV